MLSSGVIVWITYTRSARPQPSNKVGALEKVHSTPTGGPEKDGFELDGISMLGSDSQKHELKQQAWVEILLGKDAEELPGEHGASELNWSSSVEMPGYRLDARDARDERLDSSLLKKVEAIHDNK